MLGYVCTKPAYSNKRCREPENAIEEKSYDTHLIVLQVSTTEGIYNSCLERWKVQARHRVLVESYLSPVLYRLVVSAVLFIYSRHKSALVHKFEKRRCNEKTRMS